MLLISVWVPFNTCFSHYHPRGERALAIFLSSNVWVILFQQLVFTSLHFLMGNAGIRNVNSNDRTGSFTLMPHTPMEVFVSLSLIFKHCPSDHPTPRGRIARRISIHQAHGRVPAETPPQNVASHGEAGGGWLSISPIIGHLGLGQLAYCTQEKRGPISA